jgi:hypothetical protein
MMKLSYTFLLLFGFLCNRLANAQPLNDYCTDAVTIPSTPTFPYTHTILDFHNATRGANDPVLSCFQNVPLDNNPERGNRATIWYSWTPSTSGSFDFLAAAVPKYRRKTVFAPAIGIWQGATCSDSLEEVTAACHFGSAAAIHVTAGTHYFVLLEYDPYFEFLFANMTLTIQPTPPPPPNDECVKAMEIPSEATFPYTTTAVAIFQATEHPTDPLLTCTFLDSEGFGDNYTGASSLAPSDGTTVWYSWTPAESGSYDFSTVGSLDAWGYEIDTAMGLYEGDACSTSKEIQCTNGGPLRGVALVGGTTYRIPVRAVAACGTLTLTVTLMPPSNDVCADATVILNGTVVLSSDM